MRFGAASGECEGLSDLFLHVAGQANRGWGQRASMWPRMDACCTTCFGEKGAAACEPVDARSIAACTAGGQSCSAGSGPAAADEDARRTRSTTRLRRAGKKIQTDRVAGSSVFATAAPVGESHRGGGESEATGRTGPPPHRGCSEGRIQRPYLPRCRLEEFRGATVRGWTGIGNSKRGETGASLCGELACVYPSGEKRRALDRCGLQ